MERIPFVELRLAYEQHGKGAPMVLLHGFPLDHHLWDDVVPLLEDTFELLVPDLRGFGESTIGFPPVTIDKYAIDIADMLDFFSIQKAAIVGHSMGGYVALAFARLYPERVSGLALISTQVLADPPDRKEGRYKSAADVAEKGIGGVVEAMTSKFTSDPRLQAITRTLMEKQPPDAYIGALEAMAERIDSTALLSTFKFPVVIVHGEADALIPVARAREVKAAVPHSHYVELKDTGHVPMLEAAKETAEALNHLA